MHGGILNWNGVPVFPGGAHPYGNDVILQHAANWFGGDVRAGLILTLVDVWILDAQALSDANVACWVPVDHDPAPPKVAQFFRDSDAWPIAMSRFGQQWLADQGVDAMYVPHGIDTDAFQPADMREAKAALGLPADSRVVLMVAANKGFPSRKGYPEAFSALADVMRDDPLVRIVCHTEPLGIMDGINLPNLAQATGIPLDRLVFSGQSSHIQADNVGHLRMLYSAAEVLLAPSYGEGFGIPLAEAQACGCPVITTDYTSMPEVGKTGWLVGGQRFYSPQGSWWMIPAVPEIRTAVRSALEPGARGRLSAAAREHALTYSTETVWADHWAPTLQELERRVNGRPSLVGEFEVPA